MATMSDFDARQAPPAHGKARAIHAARTRDIDQQAALLRGWNQTYDQISTGPFSGSFLEAQLDAVLLFREVTSNALHQTGAPPAGTVAVGVPITLRGNATFCGQKCNGAQLHIFSGNDCFEFFSPRGLDIAGFVLTEQDLSGALTAQEMETVFPSLATPHLQAIDCAEADQMRRVFNDACEVITSCRDVFDDAARLSSMSRDVIAAVVGALTCADARGSEIPSGKRALIVRDARDLVRDAPDRYASVEELCRTLGVSRRALQQSFQETLDLKPSAFLRAVRMNGARRAIKDASSVAEAATLWGFWHFGRFARDYKVMFGELPSEAFRRYHGTNGAESVEGI